MSAQNPAFGERLQQRFPDEVERKAALLRSFWRLDAFVSLLDNEDVLREAASHYKDKLQDAEFDPVMRNAWVDVSEIHTSFFVLSVFYARKSDRDFGDSCHKHTQLVLKYFYNLK